MDSQFRHHKMTDRRQSTANLTTLVILSEAKDLCIFHGITTTRGAPS